jgi:hypothetical protein
MIKEQVFLTSVLKKSKSKSLIRKTYAQSLSIEYHISIKMTIYQNAIKFIKIFSLKLIIQLLFYIIDVDTYISIGGIGSHGEIDESYSDIIGLD